MSTGSRGWRPRWRLPQPWLRQPAAVRLAASRLRWLCLRTPGSQFSQLLEEVKRSCPGQLLTATDSPEDAPVDSDG
jgi:hypothetical protein